jgi:putative transcriptional regulator
MSTVRRTRAEVDRETLLAEFAKRRRPTEAEIDRQAVEDDDAWTEEDAARAVSLRPPPTAEEIKALRARFGLSQAQFAHRFGLTVDTVQQYEQGRRVPSGPAAVLLRVIAAEPGAVMRALKPHKSA